MFKHQKVTTRINKEDGSVEITADSYYEQLAHTLVEIEKHVPTSRQTVLKELINCLEYITRDKSTEVNIQIKARNGEPIEITKRWVTVKESFNRR